MAHAPSASRIPLLALVLAALPVLGCPPAEPEKPKGPAAEARCPKDFPTACKVLKDETNSSSNSVEYHVLVPGDTKHGQAQKLLESLYRHLMTRRDSEPAALAGYLYTSEGQFSTPPVSPVASIVKNAEAKIPVFENKLPLELWQQTENALDLDKRADRKLKRKLTYTADEDQGRVSITLPLTESGKEDWMAALSFNQAMNHFTEIAQSLFSRAPDLKALHYVALWKDQEVMRIEVTRADYNSLHLREVEDRIGALHGRAFQELATSPNAESSVERGLAARTTAEYRKILAQLKSSAFVSPQLK